MNKVQIIADSKNEFGQRLITAILTFPRYLLAEVNTHRMLSRNSASSRAIRFEKMVQSVMENPFIPMRWQKDHPGMQGNNYVTNPLAIKRLEELWLEGRDSAVERAKALHILQGDGITEPNDYLTDFSDDEDIRISKQICNRLLEPYMMHTALVSGTELENFFALRAEDGAEIHFQDLAYKFLDAVNQSEPKQLKAGEWHIPFGDEINDGELAEAASPGIALSHIGLTLQDLRIKIATVRCARISYITPGQIGKFDYKADLKLHDRLASSGHWSAFEHCAKAMSSKDYVQWHKVEEGSSENGWCGNFRGFIQYRKIFNNENRNDNRLIKK